MGSSALALWPGCWERGSRRGSGPSAAGNWPHTSPLSQQSNTEPVGAEPEVLGAELRPWKPGSPRPTPDSSPSPLRRPVRQGAETKKMRGRRDVVEQGASLRRHLQRASKYQSVYGKWVEENATVWQSQPRPGYFISVPCDTGSTLFRRSCPRRPGRPGRPPSPRPNLVSSGGVPSNSAWPCPRLQSEHGTRQPALETGSSTLPRNLTSWGNGDPDLLGSRARRGGVRRSDCSTGWGGAVVVGAGWILLLAVSWDWKAEWLGVSCQRKAGREGIAMKGLGSNLEYLPQKVLGFRPGKDMISQSFPVVFNRYTSEVRAWNSCGGAPQFTCKMQAVNHSSPLGLETTPHPAPHRPPPSPLRAAAELKGREFYLCHRWFLTPLKAGCGASIPYEDSLLPVT